MLTIKERCKQLSKDLGYKLRSYVEHKTEVIIFIEHENKTLLEAIDDFKEIGECKFSGEQPDHYYIAIETN